MDQSDEEDQKAYLEVTLPSFGVPVLYSDSLNGQIAKKFDYPPYMVEGYQKFAQAVGALKNDPEKTQKLSILD